MNKLLLFFAMALLITPAQSQTQIFGSNTYQTFSSAGTTNTASSNATFKLYSAVGQPIAMSSVDLTKTQAGVLSAVSNGIVVLDAVPPVIVAPTSAVTLSQGASNTFSVTVTDNIAVAAVKINYKTITAPVASVASAPMTAGTANAFSVAVQSSWFDAMGVEYFFTATDKAGNSARIPAAANTFLRTQLTTPSLTLPQIPFGNVKENYRMVAFPYDLGSDAANAVSAIYNGISLDDDSKARMYNYDPGTKNYLEFKTGGFAKIERGKSYWIQTKDQKSVSVSNVTAPPDHRASLFKVTLKPGWNQVGNPYPVNISWSDVQTFNNNNPNIGKLNVFTGAFTESNVLSPFLGGFVKNPGGSDIQVTIPFQGQTVLGGRQERSPGTDISQEEWNVLLGISQQGPENRLGGFGMHPLSQAGPDRYDNYNPPRFLVMPEVNFSHAEIPGLTFSNDMVATANRYQWKLVPFGENEETSLLTWSHDINTSGQELFLFDEQRLTLTDMLSTDQYSFTQQKDSRFSIYYGHDVMGDIRPEEPGASAPYPNPLTNDRTTTWMVAVPQSSSEARIGLQVFNGTGAAIAMDNKTCQPGLHEMKYSAEVNQSSGMYYYRLVIGTDKYSKVYTGKIIVP